MQSSSILKDASFDQPSSMFLPGTATVSHFDLSSLLDKEEVDERNTPDDDTLKSIQRRMDQQPANSIPQDDEMESENLSQRLIQEINLELAKGNQDSSYSSNIQAEASYSFDISKNENDMLDRQFDSFLRNEIVFLYF
jgi:hypothetical protein